MNKKSILLFAVIILVSLVISIAIAGEPFTLLNGIHFGMSQDEVLQIEKDTDISKNTTDDDITRNHPNVTGRYLNTRLVNIPDSTVWFYFTDDRLDYISYSFGGEKKLSAQAARFNDVERGLTSKYGEASCTSSNGWTFPVIKEGCPTQPGAVTASATLDVERYSYRLIQSDANEYIFIEHTITSINNKNSDPFYNHNVRYWILTDEEAAMAQDDKHSDL